MHSSRINCACNYNRLSQLNNNNLRTTVLKHEAQGLNTLLNNTSTMGCKILLKTRGCVIRHPGKREDTPSFWL